MAKVEKRREEIQNLYQQHLDSRSSNSKPPYDRHEEISTSSIERILAILGPGFKDELLFLRNVYRLSMQKKEIQEKSNLENNQQANEKDENEDQENEKLQTNGYKSNKTKVSKQKKTTTTSISLARKEWKLFLKTWIENCNLFHSDFPKSMHTAFFRLRVEKLAVFIYEYLHENSSKFQSSKASAENEKLDNLWMDGTFFPSEKEIDPLSSTDRRKKDMLFFSLQDIVSDLLSWLDDREKNKMKTLSRQGKKCVFNLSSTSFETLRLLKFVIMVEKGN